MKVGATKIGNEVFAKRSQHLLWYQRFKKSRLAFRSGFGRYFKTAMANSFFLSSSGKLNLAFSLGGDAGRVGSHLAHDAFSLRPLRNACRCSSGRNLKNLVIENSSISGSPWSRLAPARKSAQIISKQ